jgi:hypothetical protein
MDNSFSQAETILTIAKRSEETLSADSEILRSVQRQVAQLSAVMGNPETLAGFLIKASDAQDRMHQQSRVVEVKPGIDSAVHHENDNLSAVERSIPNERRRTRRKGVSYKHHFSNRYLYVSSITREDISNEDHSTQEFGPPKRTETTFKFVSTLPFLRRALYYTTSNTSWDPLYETKVRYTRVFTRDSAIWQACAACDLDEVRRLFISGEASPFMEDEWGVSLADQVITHIAIGNTKAENDGVQLVDYLVRNCGRGGASVSWVSVWNMLFECYYYRHLSKWNNYSSESGASILRLVVEYSREDPLDNSAISSLIDLDNLQDPLVTALTQQTFWPLNLRPALYEPGIVEENARQMLEDPEGVYLRELLEDAKYYEVRTLEGSKKVFASLFELATQSTTGNGPVALRECCKNRMKLFISTPKYHRFLDGETLDFEDVASIRLKYPSGYPHYDVYVGGCATRHGYRPLLEEVLEELGWSDFDVNDFFDKETFYCVPGLLDGEIVYETSQETQQEFILNLCDGVFTGMSKHEISILVKQISHTTNSNDFRLCDYRLEEEIEAANIAFISKSTPGSWPEEDEIKLVPGVDFVVPWGCKKYIFSWYRDYVDPDFEFELSNEDYDSE